MKYLFYRFYKGALFIRKGGDPDIRAWFVLSGFMSVNYYSIKQFYISLIHQNKLQVPLYVSIIVVLIIYTINYFLFLHRDNPQKIINKYSSESRRARITGIIIAYLYVIITVVLLLYAKHLQFS